MRYTQTQNDFLCSDTTDDGKYEEQTNIERREGTDLSAKKQNKKDTHARTQNHVEQNGKEHNC